MSTSRRGFAGMSLAKRTAIASKGGKAAHTQGTAHEWGVAEAREAGKKGGAVGKSRRTGIPLEELLDGPADRQGS